MDIVTLSRLLGHARWTSTATRWRITSAAVSKSWAVSTERRKRDIRDNRQKTEQTRAQARPERETAPALPAFWSKFVEYAQIEKENFVEYNGGFSPDKHQFCLPNHDKHHKNGTKMEGIRIR